MYTGLLDNFNRADGPLGADWGLDMFAFGYSGPVIDTQQAQHTILLPGETQSAYWLRLPASADCIAWATKRGTDINIPYIIAVRLGNVGLANVTGYLVSVNFPGFPGRVRLYRINNNASITLLSDVAYAIPLGDAVGIEASGNTLTAFHLPVGLPRVDITTAVDATYPNVGYLGFEIGTLLGQRGALDDFSGGPFVTFNREASKMTLITPDGPVATSQGGTVYTKRFGDFSRFVWGGECVYIGDIADERGGLNITTRANAREGGLQRDGVLFDPPGNVTTTLSMKRLRGDKLKTLLKKCLWIFDKRTQCNDFDDPTAWSEIERVYQGKVGTRTTTPGTSIGDSNAEEMVNFDITALESVDIYRVHIEEATTGYDPLLVKCVDICHGDRCVACGDPETDAVLVAGTELVAAGSPHIYLNTAGGDPTAWTDIAVTEWVAGDVDGIACLGQWGLAVSNTEAEVLWTRDRFTTRVAYTTAALTAHPPNAVAASSQTFAVIVADDGYIFISRDGGQSVETSLAGSITALNLTGVAIAPSNHQILYAWTSADDVILKSENAGATWFQVTATGSGGGIRSLAIHPQDANLLLVGTDNGEVFESQDGAETWTEQAQLPGFTVKANVNLVDIQAAGGGVWFLAAVEPTVSSRVYINYEDGAGGAWEYYNPIDGLEYATTTTVGDILALAAVDPNRCVAVGGDSATLDMVALIA